MARAEGCDVGGPAEDVFLISPFTLSYLDTAQPSSAETRLLQGSPTLLILYPILGSENSELFTMPSKKRSAHVWDIDAACREQAAKSEASMVEFMKTFSIPR